jgi:phosphopantetheinyl transferase
LHYALHRLGIGGRRIVASDSGKPILSGDWHFSLAHCRGMALCAIGAAGPLGADVEFVQTDAADQVVAELVFCADERDWLRGSGENFFRLWTVKEALFKAADAVWTDQWRDISVLPALRDGVWRELRVEERRFDRHYAAIAFPALAAIDWRMVTPDEIRSGAG